MDGDILFGLARFFFAVAMAVAFVSFVAFARDAERGARRDDGGDWKRAGGGRD